MPIPPTADFDAARLRAAARCRKDANQTRRLLTVAAIYDGATRTEAAAIGGVTVQIVRDWVVKLNTDGPPGLIDRRGGGTSTILTDKHCRALSSAIEDGPIPAVHGVVCWRVIDLCQWLWDGYAVRIAKQALSRELRRIGYRRLSARPRHHAQAHSAIETFKKASPRVWARSGARRVSAATG